MWVICRAKIGYWLARRMFSMRWAQRSPRVWEWMQKQYVRMADTGNKDAQAFYGHLLYHKGRGSGVKIEALRYLRMAAEQGDEKAAYQMGMHYLKEGSSHAQHWFKVAETYGHPMAEVQLEKLKQTE